MAARDHYIGQSSANYEHNKSVHLSDVKLVTQDILNHFFTRKGERVNRPEYGTRIPDIIFEPLDDDTLFIINQDSLDVIESEPRVALRSLNVIPLFDEGAVVVAIDVDFVYLDLHDRIEIRIDFEGDVPQ